MGNFERFKLANRKAGNVSFYEKDELMDDLNPTTVSLFYSKKADLWYMRLSNGTDTIQIGIMPECKPEKNVQDAADEINAAAGVLKVDPKNKKALATIAKLEGLVTGFITETFDSEENFLYGGESEKGYWLRISPNAPGTNTPVAELQYEAVAV